jgi:hypothetical protein
MASVLALRLSEVYKCLLEEGGGFMAAPFFAAWSAASFSGTCVWPGTQQIYTELLLIYINLSCASQIEPSALKDSKTSCDEPVNGDRSWVATSRLSKQIQRLVIQQVVWSSKVVLKPLQL